MGENVWVFEDLSEAEKLQALGRLFLDLPYVRKKYIASISPG